MIERHIIYRAVDKERNYQDARIGGKEKSVGDYLTLIRTCSVRADEAYYGTPGNGPALDQIRKIAALCVQCMEVHGVVERGFSIPVNPSL